MSSRLGMELTEAEQRSIEHACAALCIEYCEAVDTKNYGRLREVFAEDAHFAAPHAPDQSIRGAEAIIAALSLIPAALVTQHFALNIRVRAESADAASGSCRILLYTADANEPESTDGRKAAPQQRIGIYNDRYVRTASGWRIADRRGKALLHT